MFVCFYFKCMEVSGAFQEWSFFPGCLFILQVAILCNIHKHTGTLHQQCRVCWVDRCDSCKGVMMKTTSEQVASSLPSPNLPGREIRWIHYLLHLVCRFFRSKYAKNWSLISACSCLNLEAVYKLGVRWINKNANVLVRDTALNLMD